MQAGPRSLTILQKQIKKKDGCPNPKGNQECFCEVFKDSAAQMATLCGTCLASPQIFQPNKTIDLHDATFSIGRKVCNSKKEFEVSYLFRVQQVVDPFFSLSQCIKCSINAQTSYVHLSEESTVNYCTQGAFNFNKKNMAHQCYET